MAAPPTIAKGMQNTDNEFMSNPEKVLLETWGFKTNKIRQARCACLQGGKIISVMN